MEEERKREKGLNREGGREGLANARGSSHIFNMSLRLNGTVLRQQFWLIIGVQGHWSGHLIQKLIPSSVPSCARPSSHGLTQRK